MRRRAIFSLAASCLLAACAHQDAARAPAMAWLLTQTPEEGAKLAFGEPQSDNVVLMLTCRPGSGEVVLARTGAADQPPAIILASGGREGRFAGEATPFGGASGVYVEASAPAAHPALAAFRRTGDLTLREDLASIRLPADRAAHRRIETFFDACGAA